MIVGGVGGGWWTVGWRRKRIVHLRAIREWALVLLFGPMVVVDRTGQKARGWSSQTKG